MACDLVFGPIIESDRQIGRTILIWGGVPQTSDFGSWYPRAAGYVLTNSHVVIEVLDVQSQEPAEWHFAHFAVLGDAFERNVRQLALHLRGELSLHRPGILTPRCRAISSAFS